MIDYFLKFDERPENAGDLCGSDGVLVDVVGDIPGLDGWHLNIRMDGELPEELQKYEVEPEHPFRIWL